jgi:hypothetical protein
MNAGTTMYCKKIRQIIVQVHKCLGNVKIFTRKPCKTKWCVHQTCILSYHHCNNKVRKLGFIYATDSQLELQNYQ